MSIMCPMSLVSVAFVTLLPCYFVCSIGLALKPLSSQLNGPSRRRRHVRSLMLRIILQFAVKL